MPALVQKIMKAEAEASNYSGDATIKFEGEPNKQVMDPERPAETADPGDSPSTDHLLRIDFAPQINFWEADISDEDQLYYGNAQLFKDDTGPRGNFVQVSDFREKNTGWTLQLKQETQLQNKSIKKKELKGAVLSFDRSWVNSINAPETGPTVSKEVIRLMNIGEAYNLAEAKPTMGGGTWSIIFGASINNEKKQANTLKPRLNEENEPVLDSAFNNQPMYENQAVSLFIPGKTEKETGNYQTVLTWILSELP